MDKAGVAFLVLICILVALVVSILGFVPEDVPPDVPEVIPQTLPRPEQMLTVLAVTRKTRLVANPQNSCASCRSKQEGKMSELEENRLLDSEFRTISSEPLIGRLNLETDLGTIDLLVNKEAAEFLISVLLEFLAEGTGGDAPKFTVHTEQ